MNRYLVSAFSVLLLIALATCVDKKDNRTKLWTDADRSYIIRELERTTTALKDEIDELNETQTNFRIDSTAWSIKQIVAHLEMQNQLHFREISVMARTPVHPEFIEITSGRDSYFSDYATDPRPGISQPFLDPKDKYGTLERAWSAFYEARTALLHFTKDTQVDLRKQFTFRTEVQNKAIGELNIGEVRDLHQLLLTGIAHTDRHIIQIRKIKKSPDFPE